MVEADVRHIVTRRANCWRERGRRDRGHLTVAQGASLQRAVCERGGLTSRGLKVRGHEALGGKGAASTPSKGNGTPREGGHLPAEFQSPLSHFPAIHGGASHLNTRILTCLPIRRRGENELPGLLGGTDER